LFETGPGTALNNLWHNLTRPVAGDELRRDQRQALMNEALPLGIKPKQVDEILRRASDEVKTNAIHVMRNFEARLYRDEGSLLPSRVNAIAEDVLQQNQKGIHPAIPALRANGGFYRVLSKASSRYGRTLTQKALQGDKAAQRLRTIYDNWNDKPVLSGMATTQRMVAKTLYPIFRFTTDPRWLLMNTVESNFLALGKDGFWTAYAKASDASNAANFISKGAEIQGIMPDTGYTFGRNILNYAMKSFDKRSVKSVANVLDEYGNGSPELGTLRTAFKREADDLEATARENIAKGILTPEEAAPDLARAAHLRDLNSRGLAEELNRTLYDYQQKGVSQTVTDEARKILTTDEFNSLSQAGLLQRIREVNQKTWADVQQMYHGNAQRSTLERLMNSYWVYWPMSYQIKATKWLADIMLNGSFGHDNGALLAGKYTIWQQQHQDRLMKDAAYRALMNQYPTLWFLGQMILPITPNSLGVSLSRAPHPWCPRDEERERG